MTSVAFSMENPQLLAVGLFDGSVQVIDITEDMCSSHVAISQRKTSRPVEAVWQIKWIKSKIIWFTCLVLIFKRRDRLNISHV